ncbi:ground-like domain-containing protein [Ditylenchus destructor]|uniref:Ground-like domain-containing protein n=1 Tax=Ditylenchus destructor TaxID=166010 RepID=A0AAD4NJE3_9BILA|nr:ground-like domain-containing protein [Ditylenchus destructor]
MFTSIKFYFLIVLLPSQIFGRTYYTSSSSSSSSIFATRLCNCPEQPVCSQTPSQSISNTAAVQGASYMTGTSSQPLPQVLPYATGSQSQEKGIECPPGHKMVNQKGSAEKSSSFGTESSTVKTTTIAVDYSEETEEPQSTETEFSTTPTATTEFEYIDDLETTTEIVRTTTKEKKLNKKVKVPDPEDDYLSEVTRSYTTTPKDTKELKEADSSKPAADQIKSTERDGCGGPSCIQKLRRRAAAQKLYKLIHAIRRRIVKRRAVQRDDQLVDPKCNSERLRNIILQGRGRDTTSVKRNVQLLAEQKLQGRYNVVCAENGSDFSYITNTEEFCQETVAGKTCYVFKQFNRVNNRRRRLRRRRKKFLVHRY